ncbi:MAG: hypothetical protein ACHQ6T_11255 [Myxococcota bacterium]
MRLLPLAALVLASLVFSVGGVAIKGRADASGQTSPQASQQSPAAPPQAQVINQCEPRKFRPVVGNPARLALPGDAIPLNTRGYNYPDIGELKIDPAARASAADSQPPAAPAKP